ncbi:Tim10/DDP family zinc finger domain containing protein [Nitzschia inconspicua]|uniref:Tim10/DDP family zinc finger domain containing protein n=1 Tax=Nitzschia inconspicua TaxID=303405 RepID=A0A9K3KF82_9STRA|nr:Tim10/DDP family zinc finger domain containing protein [Nitzschia inconspicua]KAG7363373.1 Tim10/DDP family zinc finger domain containing protein [Nitzschia inconspicua]
MNFFGGGGQQQQPQGPDSVFAAKTELEMYTDLFNKIAASCFQKCASRRHKEPDLSLGEMTCTDRCVSKYLEGQQLIGMVLQKANEEQLQQQQAAAAMAQQFGG